MSSLYLPLSGNIRVVDGLSIIKKLYLPPAQRSFPAGCPMWDNGANGIEPAGLSTTAAGHVATTASGTTYASTYTSADANANTSVNYNFAALFAGFAAEGRLPQQLATVGQFSAPGSFAQYADDASRNFIPVYTEGIAIAPCAALAGQLEQGTPVDLACFQNEAGTGWYDPAGCLQQDTKYYAYMNQVQASLNAVVGVSIGRLVERALVGDTVLKFSFQSAILSLALIG